MNKRKHRIMMVSLTILICTIICLIGWRYFYRSYDCPGANVIFISIDTLRTDHMGCYGYKRNTTKNIDKFSENAVFFQQAYAPWPKTTPSFASFFTGMHPFTTGVERIAPYQWLEDKLIFLTEVLKKEGYFTQGRVTNPNLTTFCNFNQGFDVYDYNDLDAAGVTRLAISDLKKIKEEKTRGRFLYWVHYMDPHYPYKPPNNYGTFFLNDKLYDSDPIVPVCEGNPNYIEMDNKMDPYERTRREGILRPDFRCSGFEKGRLSDVIARYDGEITFMDENIGILLEEIKTLGLFENSIIVLWADHGESLGDHNFYFDHGRLPYNPCLKVPLFIYNPKIKPKKVRSPVSLTDVFPTILGMLGNEAICDGEDVKCLVLGKEKKRAIFASAGYALDYQKIMTDGRWKLIYIPDKLDRQFMTGEEYELYDLKNDPQEKDNLYGKDVEGMYLREVMDQFLKNTYREYTGKRNSAAYFPDVLMILKSLGYIK